MFLGLPTAIWLAIAALSLIAGALAFFAARNSERLRRRRLNSKRSEMADYFLDYYNIERGLMIRVFAPNFDVEAMKGISPSQILEKGIMANMYEAGGTNFHYYLIQL